MTLVQVATHYMQYVFKMSYRKSRCISQVLQTKNRAKVLDVDLYTESKPSIIK